MGQLVNMLSYRVLKEANHILRNLSRQENTATVGLTLVTLFLWGMFHFCVIRGLLDYARIP